MMIRYLDPWGYGLGARGLNPKPLNPKLGDPRPLAKKAPGEKKRQADHGTADQPDQGASRTHPEGPYTLLLWN